jgi:aspartyl-tRNA(Asn)/glutamyl-tRNA(Gln) amidotransferase subunit A
MRPAVPSLLERATLAQLGDLLDRREVSAVDLAHHFLGRIERHRDLNAFLDVRPEASLAQAHAADERRARGESGPLLGVPVAHKDVFVTRAWDTTAASRILRGYRSPFDATVVTQLAQAGMVCLGKLNCDEFAMGSSNENSAYGKVLNPWDRGAVPGGSSGGSAAAVAARLVPLATGTDTGGSIREPAAFSGVTGIKPTYGRPSRWGMIAFASSLDTAGLIGTNARDCALGLSAMAGFDPKDSTSVERPPEDYARALDIELRGLRIGVPREYFAEGLEPEVEASVRAALRELEAQGAILVDVRLPNAALGIPVYYVVSSAEASSNLSRFDGVRYGFRAEAYGDLLEMMRKTRAQGFGAEVKRRVLVGTYVLSRGYYDAYYLQAARVRRIIAEEFERAFAQCDLIAGPVSAGVAFGFGEKSTDPVAMYLADLYTVPGSLVGIPAMSVPCGFGRPGRPIGLQLMARHFDEARMLGVAHRYQCITDWHARVPPGC